MRIEQLLLFMGLLLYAILASLDQHPPLLIMMFAILGMGNLLLPLAFFVRRFYANRPLPWNWVAFFPCRSGSEDSALPGVSFYCS